MNNLCHIAYAVQAGEDCRIAAKAMICESVIIGNNVWIGSGSNISNGLTIGNGASITIGSTVLKDVEENKQVTGYYGRNTDCF